MSQLLARYQLSVRTQQQTVTRNKAWESNILYTDLVNVNPENQFLKEAREADSAE